MSEFLVRPWVVLVGRLLYIRMHEGVYMLRARESIVSGLIKFILFLIRLTLLYCGVYCDHN